MRFITINKDSKLSVVVTEYTDGETLPDNVFQVSEKLWKRYHRAIDDLREVENQLYFVRSLYKETE
jgi:hypothetical protein